MNLGASIRLNRRGALLLAALALVALLILALSRGRGDAALPGEAGTGAGSGPGALRISGKRLLSASVMAARRGGVAVKRGADGELNVRLKGTAEAEPVTDADVASHCAMFYGLKSVFPRLRLRSEERPPAESCERFSGSLPADEGPVELSEIDRLDDVLFDPKDISVWIDPLDATKEFTEKSYKYVTTMVCVAHRGVPIMGVIHQPFRDDGATYWAWVDRIVSPGLLESRRNTHSKSHTRVIVSISHQGEVEEFSKTAFGRDSEVISAAGSGFKVLKVIEDEADVYIHTTNIKKWDICAGNAIINAVGGKMTTLDNKTVSYFYDSDEYNKEGLLVSVKNHDYYVKKTSLLREKNNT